MSKSTMKRDRRDYFFFLDQASQKILKNDRPKVLLYGGDSGNGNFGDILQLKSTIAFHRKKSGLLPVVLFDVGNVSDAGYVERMKDFYGVDAIVLMSSEFYDFSQGGIDLHPLREIRDLSLLHFYGGGMLNEFWGEEVLHRLQYLIEAFKIDRYVVSGQQIDPNFVNRLEKFLAKFPPLMFGVRDDISLEAVKRIYPTVRFSFDDAVEPLQTIVSRIPQKGKKHLVGHFNTSYYTANESNLDAIIGYFKALKTRYPNKPLTLINAFSTLNFDVYDTLRSLTLMGDRFPYGSYRLVDGAKLAYRLKVEEMAWLRGEMCITTSYHVALFMLLAGTPVWLAGNNAFYRHKRKALGIERSFDEFVKSPTLPDLKERLKERRIWHEHLRDKIKALESVENVRRWRTRKRDGKPFAVLSGRAVALERFEEVVKSNKWFERQIQNYRHTIEEKNKDIQQKAEAIQWFERQIQNYQKTLEGKEEGIRWLQEQIRNYQNTLQMKEESLHRLEENLQILEETVQDKEKAMASLEDLLQQTRKDFELYKTRTSTWTNYLKYKLTGK